MEIDFIGVLRIFFRFFFGDCGVMRLIFFKESFFGMVIICFVIIFVCLDKIKWVFLIKKFFRVRECFFFIWLNFVLLFNVVVMVLVVLVILKFSIWFFFLFELLKVVVWLILIIYIFIIVVGYGVVLLVLYDSNFFRVLYCI